MPTSLENISGDELRRSEFSHGGNSWVYQLAPKERASMGADFLREQLGWDPVWAIRFKAQMNIAELLFPGHFIHVVGWEMDPPLDEEGLEGVEAYLEKFPVVPMRPGFMKSIPSGPLPTGEQCFPLRHHRNYSKDAGVPRGHGVYSAHMTLDPPGFQGSKLSLCGCAECAAHRDFHAANDIKARASQLSVWQAGLLVSLDDESDYCMTAAGNVIFFEIEHVDTPKLRAFVEQLTDVSLKEQALALLPQLERLYAISLGSNERFLGPISQ